MSKTYSVLIIDKSTDRVSFSQGRQLAHTPGCVVVKMTNGWTVTKQYRHAWEQADIRDAYGKRVTHCRVTL